MLVGIAAAVAPLILHLLSRSRYKNVDWAGMMFLEGADAQKSHSARFTQIILLLLRSATIALLALALARPVLRGVWAGQQSNARVTAVLLLDCSASMGFDENGQTRFQMAQTAARQIIRALRPGDRVSLILMGVPRTAADLEPTGDLRAIEAKIDEARVGLGKADIRDALDAAAEALERYEQSARDVYVVTDRQALSWQGIDAHFASEWNRRMRRPGLNTRMFVLPVGSADADNIAVESARLVNPPAIVGQPTDIEVVIRNYGTVQHAAAPVSLTGANFSAPPRSINLAPGQAVPVIFTADFAQLGSQILTARVKSAGYTGDDQLDLAVNVIPPIRVLVLSGDEHGGPFHGAGDFLKWSLAPHRSAGVSGGDPCSVTVLPPEAWNDADLGKFQVVILANVERFSPQQGRAIEKYVYSGGRLLVAPGNLSRVENYNAQLYREGAGVLPALLQPPTAADGSDATSIMQLQIDHPIFQFLHGRSEPPAESIVRYCPAIPRQVDADVLGRYVNNDPFLIEGRSERGRVLLLTTSLDADWSTLPLSNFYLPFVQSAVRYLAGGAVANANLAPGELIRLSLDNPAAAQSIVIDRPDGRAVKLELARFQKQTEIRYGDTDQPGVYRIAVQEAGRAAESAYFVVRPPREESDLTQLTDERWDWLENGLGFKRVDVTARPVMEVLAAHREGQELWGALLLAMLALSVVELWVAKIASVQRQADRAVQT